ncbi:APO protein 3, mitochondrial-like [Phalaenopsis equestris]|uniref:APO protein 3, mitochondrial-like n=1 Tax=Phalaenopsis equestris TaxID=78828 RepID=UPI0009E2F90C|nr:APO protein 3, mitochondrial-like [Phalaenopsis equestris]
MVQIGAILRISNQRFFQHYEQLAVNIALSYLKSSMCLFSTSSGRFTEHAEVPGRRQRSERKPLVTSINELKRSARLDRKKRQDVREILLRPPENGLLVKRLIPVAHEVYNARKELYDCVSSVLKSVLVHVCRFCEEVYVGEFPHQIRTCDVAGSLPTKEHCWVPGGIENVLPVVDSFHLYDRLGRAVSHEERLQVDRIPAIIELCVQAGVDLSEYPSKRRPYPVYNIAGKLIDFERKFPRDYSSGKDIEPHGFWLRKKDNNHCNTPFFLSNEDLQGIAVRGMSAWERMRLGAVQLMEKYAVQTCGYCPEVQVGPKGHRARICQAYKHQMRDGQHAWQKAAIDDLVPPVYVWHVPGPYNGGKLLVHNLRMYYGKLPAVVELFAQAGACVGECGLLREDVAVPGLDEDKLVV